MIARSLACALARPLVRGAARPLVQGAPGSPFDPDAEAWFAATEAQGATWDEVQKTAISDFYVAEKLAGRWTGVKRMYLPVTGIAAANAICMKTLASGTFNGGVTHASGYTQGNGTTGYFNAGTPASAGVSTGSCMIFSLMVEDAVFYSGCYGPGADFAGLSVYDTGAQIGGRAPSENSVMGTAASGGGVLLASQTSATARAVYQRLTAGFSIITSNTTNDTTPLLPLDLYFSGGLNNNGSFSALTTAKYGSYGIGTGYTASAAEAFSLSLKTLWETVTGLTLP